MAGKTWKDPSSLIQLGKMQIIIPYIPKDCKKNPAQLCFPAPTHFCLSLW